MTDFGVAIEHNKRRNVEAGGSIQYMSPEQVESRSGQIDGRTDIWAMGVLLYEMTTGHRPFSGDTRNELTTEICEIAPKPVSQWRPSVSSVIESICSRCLEKKISDRFSSASNLLEALLYQAAELSSADSYTELSTRLSGDKEPEEKTRREVVTTGCIAVAALATVIILAIVGLSNPKQARELLKKIFKSL